MVRWGVGLAFRLAARSRSVIRRASLVQEPGLPARSGPLLAEEPGCMARAGTAPVGKLRPRSALGDAIRRDVELREGSRDDCNDRQSGSIGIDRVPVRSLVAVCRVIPRKSSWLVAAG